MEELQPAGGEVPLVLHHPPGGRCGDGASTMEVVVQGVPLKLTPQSFTKSDTLTIFLWLLDALASQVVTTSVQLVSRTFKYFI